MSSTHSDSRRSRPSLLSPASLGLHWETHNDWLTVGEARLRVYRVTFACSAITRPRPTSVSSAKSSKWNAPAASCSTTMLDRPPVRLPVIELLHITKTFGDLVAVCDLSLTVQPGEFFAILGPNAAGKTTTIKVLTGLVKPTSGTVRVAASTPLPPLGSPPAPGLRARFPLPLRQAHTWEFLPVTGQMFHMPDRAIQAPAPG